MATNDTAEKPYVCDVEGCGRSFTRPQGLGRHRVEIHGFEPSSSKSRAKDAQVPVIDPGTYEGQVKLQLQSLVAPLRVQLADIEQKITETQHTLTDLRKAKVDVTSVLTKLEPPMSNRNGNRDNGAREYHDQLLVTKANQVAELLDKNPERFPEGFTATLLAETLTEDVDKGLSTKSAAKVIEILRDRNLVRAERVTRGGGMNYLLIGKDT